jgi:sugar O-acyltransferase (sialic acid O-acetyltransferase NeuD family)
MTARPLLVVGAGGFAREAAETARAIHSVDGSVSLLGFLDDDPTLHGTTVGGTPVLGPVEAVSDHPDAVVVVAVGRPDAYTVRRELVARLGLPTDRYATLVHPAASVGSTCSVGSGTVVLAQVVMTADVMVGHHVVVMPQVVLPHDVRVDDYATLASGVRLGGGVHVGTGAYVASGVGVREGCRIGSWALVGMGSTVLQDVPDERVWFGSPARDVRRAPLPWAACQNARPSSSISQEVHQ